MMDSQFLLLPEQFLPSHRGVLIVGNQAVGVTSIENKNKEYINVGMHGIEPSSLAHVAQADLPDR